MYFSDYAATITHFDNFKTREDFEDYCFRLYHLFNCKEYCNLYEICEKMNSEERNWDSVFPSPIKPSSYPNGHYKNIYSNFVSYYRKEKLGKLLGGEQ